MTRKLLPVLALLCTGCSTVPAVEYAWQGLALVDTLQTVTVAQSPTCLYETDARAAALYGSPHPAESRVLFTNGALAVLHLGIATWLDANDWTTALRIFEGISFAYSGQAVIHNTRMGIGLAAGNICTTPH